MVEQMKIQFGHQTEASLDQIVRLASILEPQYKGRKASETTLSIYKSAAAVEHIEPDTRRKLNCGHCHKDGHVERDCFAKKSKCYECGRTGHLVRSCPKRDENTRQQPRRGIIAPVPRQERLMCNFCGEAGRFMSRCDVFRAQFCVCVWCGGSDHQSYQCNAKPVTQMENGQTASHCVSFN